MKLSVEILITSIFELSLFSLLYYQVVALPFQAFLDSLTPPQMMLNPKIFFIVLFMNNLAYLSEPDFLG